MAARRKKAAKQELTVAEDLALTEYRRYNRARSMEVFWRTVEERDAMQQASRRDGCNNFSEWVAAQVRKSIQPAAEMPLVAMLKEQLARVQSDLEYERERCREADAAAKKWEVDYRNVLDRLQALRIKQEHALEGRRKK